MASASQLPQAGDKHCRQAASPAVEGACVLGHDLGESPECSGLTLGRVGQCGTRLADPQHGVHGGGLRLGQLLDGPQRVRQPGECWRLKSVLHCPRLNTNVRLASTGSLTPHAGVSGDVRAE